MNLKNTLAGAALFATLAFTQTTIANAQQDLMNQESTYVKVQGGLLNVNKVKGDYGKTKTKNSGLFGLGFGGRVADNVRTELVVDYRPSVKYKSAGLLESVEYGVGNVSASQKVTSLSAMANVFFDFGPVGVAEPYVGAGVGYGRNKTGTLKVSLNNNDLASVKGKAKNNFIWNAGVGVGFRLNEQAVLDVSYRYVDLGKFESQGVANIMSGPNAGKSTTLPHRAHGRLKGNEFLVGLRLSF